MMFRLGCTNTLAQRRFLSSLLILRRSILSSRSGNKAGATLGSPLPVGRGKGEGPLCAALFFSAEPKNFDAWRRSRAPGAEVPHPALRAGLSRQGEVIGALILQKSTVLQNVGEGEEGCSPQLNVGRVKEGGCRGFGQGRRDMPYFLPVEIK